MFSSARSFRISLGVVAVATMALVAVIPSGTASAANATTASFAVNANGDVVITYNIDYVGLPILDFFALPSGTTCTSSTTVTDATFYYEVSPINPTAPMPSSGTAIGPGSTAYQSNPAVSMTVTAGAYNMCFLLFDPNTTQKTVLQQGLVNLGTPPPPPDPTPSPTPTNGSADDPVAPAYTG